MRGGKSNICSYGASYDYNICTYKYELAKNSFTRMRAFQSVSSNNMGKSKVDQHDTSDKTIDNSGSILRQV